MSTREQTGKEDLPVTDFEKLRNESQPSFVREFATFLDGKQKVVAAADRLNGGLGEFTGRPEFDGCRAFHLHTLLNGEGGQMVGTVLNRGSHQIVATDSHTFDVEGTPGGHFIKVTDVNGSWSGLYHCDATLTLRASCVGRPPSELVLSCEVREMLIKIIAAL